MLACALSLSVLAADPAASNADDNLDGRDWFERMGKAVETRNYRGKMVHMHNGQLDMLEVVHQFKNGKVYERVTSLNGSGREVIRKGDDVRCTYTERKQVFVDWGTEQSPLNAVLPLYDQSLEKHYRFDLVPNSGRVAGRAVHTVNIQPLDEFRYGYRLQVDTETAMPLKCELLGEDRRSIEQVMFTSIDFDTPLSADAFSPLLPTTNFEEVSAAPSEADVVDVSEASWQAESLPDGFSLTVVTRHGDSDAGAEHLVYTDGVATISVFAEKRRENIEVIDGAAHIGAANAFGRKLEDFQITVVGEVPTATVELVGKSIRPIR
jgi:sigma-E factor negative regulatory protein RseB